MTTGTNLYGSVRREEHEGDHAPDGRERVALPPLLVSRVPRESRTKKARGAAAWRDGGCGRLPAPPDRRMAARSGRTCVGGAEPAGRLREDPRSDEAGMPLDL